MQNLFSFFSTGAPGKVVVISPINKGINFQINYRVKRLVRSVGTNRQNRQTSSYFYKRNICLAEYLFHLLKQQVVYKILILYCFSLLPCKWSLMNGNMQGNRGMIMEYKSIFPQNFKCNFEIYYERGYFNRG